MKPSIEVAGVSKRFRLYHEKYSSLKERVIHLGRNPYEEFWALRDINLEIEEGTTVGLLGHNGSGKSTLLKCIASILQPTSGEIRTRGRLAALLELGAGFHPDLTGRENVFLNASILGLSRKETAARFDDIVEFSELEPFIDNQVKYYSSGMYVRLGFAVAVNMDPEILMVDEVLAVGDEAFQRKCLDRVRQFQRDGRTILFVTHAADLVRQICDKVAVLDKGKIVAWGDPGEAVRTFREGLLHLSEDGEVEPEPVAGDAAGSASAAPELPAGVALEHATFVSPLHITHVRFDHPAPDHEYLLPGEALTVHIGYRADDQVSDVVVGVAVYDIEGRLLFGANNRWYQIQLSVGRGEGEFVMEFGSIPLLDGTYLVTVGLVTSDEGTVYDWHEQKHHFSVMNPFKTGGLMHLPAVISVHPEPASAPATEPAPPVVSVAGVDPSPS